MLSVEHIVPKSMELVHIVMIFEGEGIGSAVSRGPLRVVLLFIVEWLDNVSHEVDQQAESIRLGITLIIWVESVLNVVIVVAILVVISLLAGQPGDRVGDSHNQVPTMVVIKFVVILSALGDPLSSLEVEVSLPGTSMVLDVIGKGGCFHEWMINFPVGEVWVGGSQDGKQFKCCLEAVRMVLFQQVLCNVGNYTNRQVLVL